MSDEIKTDQPENMVSISKKEYTKLKADSSKLGLIKILLSDCLIVAKPKKKKKKSTEVKKDA